MLILNRRVNETILIKTKDGELVRITVSRIKGKSVMLSFHAAPETEILREEITERPKPSKGNQC